MDFKVQYATAMQQQAPKMFNELRKTGALDKHLSDKSAEAHQIVADLMHGQPTLPNGLPKDPQKLREAEEQALSTVIEFPSEGRIPDTDGEPIPEPALRTG
jgi:uncharacterized phage infection (PIP) family protein YhgE